jgi:hypothetical protein
MIGVNFAGQLGNQMFRYACARALGEKRKDKVYKYKFMGKNRSILDLSIQQGNIVENDLVLSEGFFFQKVLYILFKIIYRLIPTKDRNLVRYPSYLVSKGICLAGNINDYSIENSIGSKRVFLNGTFENSMYFSDIRSILLKEFVPKLPLIENNRSLYEVITKTNSVCISVRRGDFLKKENKGWFDVCTKEYYLEAIEKIQSLIENPVFVFFSNDISWVKANIHVDAKCYYESGNDPVWETLRLMSSCKNFVISNSTFHWWAQYLCTNPNKIVISPSRWYNAPGPYPLILNSFITIVV